MDVIESPMVTEVSAVVKRKAFCARKSAGQQAGSLDECSGGRKERTWPMDATELPMVTEVSAVHARKACCARNNAGQPTGFP